MESVCGRESSMSPPSVVAPVAVKPPPLNDGHPISVPTDQQRLLYQLALAERLRLASAGLAWARPPLSTAHQHLQEHGMGGHLVGGLMSTHLMGGFGSPLMGSLGTAGLSSALLSGQSAPTPGAYPPPHPLYGYRLVDPRAFLARGPEEPKPQHSYIGLIAMAILSSADKKLVLSDIYQYILDNYPYFRSRGPGWRNSIRHNLSLNDCFVKAGRSANGKGHYWGIHPANIDDFRRGDFRRRRAQRRVRKHLGLAVDDDSSPEPPEPTPSHTTSVTDTPTTAHLPHTALSIATDGPQSQPTAGAHPQQPVARKRQFDVASLLAPDDKMPKSRRHATDTVKDDPHGQGDIDVVSDDAADDTRPPATSPSPTPTTQDDDDDPRPWSLLGWVSGGPWALPPPPSSDEVVLRPPSNHETGASNHEPSAQ